MKTKNKIAIATLLLCGGLLTGAGFSNMNAETAFAAEAEQSTSIFEVQSAALRIPDANYGEGIRFTIVMDKDTYTNENVANLTTGILIAPTYALDAEGLVIESDITEMKNVTDGVSWTEADGVMKLYVHLYGIPDAEYATEVSIRAYVDDNDEATAPLYTDVATSSVAEAATWLYANDTTLSDEEKATLKETYLTYGVFFHDGEEVEEATGVYGEKISAPEVDEKAGYTFGGWWNKAGTAQWNFDEMTISGTTTNLYAKWNINTYTAKVVRADGTEETVEFTINDREEKLAQIALTANDAQYTYSWVSALPGELALNNDQVFTEKRDVNTYTVTFDVDGGSTVEAQVVPYGTPASELSNFSSTKEGYDFAGWTLEDGSEIPASATVTSDITVKASWAPSTNTAYNVEIYVETLDGYSEEAMQTIAQVGTTGETITLTTDWMAAQGLTIPEGYGLDMENSVFSGAVAADGGLVLKVYLKLNEYTVSYNGSATKAKHGSTLSFPADPTMEGYIFKEWQVAGVKVDETYVVTGDTTVDAVWYVDLTAESLFDIDLSSNGTYEFDTSAIGQVTAVSIAGENVAIQSSNASTLTIANATIKSLAMKGGEHADLVLTTENAEYMVKYTAVTMYIYNYDDLLEFVAIRGSVPCTTQSSRNVYEYGVDEYYVLAADIVYNASAGENQVIGNGSRNAGTSAATGFLQGIHTIGFRGTFDGRGHTIKGYKFNIGGLFGDLGQGSVVKNLGIVGGIDRFGHCTALALYAYGATIDNCYFEIDEADRIVGNNGLMCSQAGSLTIRNTVFNNKSATNANQANFAVYGNTDAGRLTTYTIENVLMVYRGASSNFLANNNTGIYAEDLQTGLYKVNGTAADFDYASADISGLSIDMSGFNTEYFTVEAGKLPQWNSKESKVYVDLTATSLFDIDLSSTADYTFNTSAIGQVMAVSIGGRNVAIQSSNASTLTIANATIKSLAMKGGEHADLVLTTENAEYMVKYTAVTMYIYNYDDLLEFVAIRGSVPCTTQSSRNVYEYGVDEYYVLAADIVYNASAGENQVIGNGSRNAGTSAATGFLQGIHTIGFRGTFDGRGHTIKGYKFNIGGLFGDLGQGSVVKNLGIVGGIDRFGHCTALALYAYGATIDNCYFEIDEADRIVGNNGLMCSQAGSLTIRNTVFNNKSAANANQANFAVYGNTDDGRLTTYTIENVLLVYRGGSSNFLANNNTGAYAEDLQTGLYKVNGTASDFNYASADISGLSIDVSGFNTEYFTVEAGKLPQWKNA